MYISLGCKGVNTPMLSHRTKAGQDLIELEDKFMLEFENSDPDSGRKMRNLRPLGKYYTTEHEKVLCLLGN